MAAATEWDDLVHLQHAEQKLAPASVAPSLLLAERDLLVLAAGHGSFKVYRLRDSIDHGSESIPPELGNRANLERLLLGGNELSGSIPSELGTLANLEYLYLGGNQLSGCVPAKLLDVPANDVASFGLPSC